MTCSRTGEITIHNIFPNDDKLRKKVESVLTGSETMLMTKDLVQIVIGYAGLFSKAPAEPKDQFAEIDYTAQDSNRGLKNFFK